MRAHRALLPGQSLAREYSHEGHHFVSRHRHHRSGRHEKPEPARPIAACRAERFADWRLSVEGRVARPRTFSLAELKQFPSRTQITRHTCEEGWTAIGQWTGVPLSRGARRGGHAAGGPVRGVLLIR